MVHIDTKVQSNNKTSLLQPSRVYSEVVHYLDTHWNPTTNLVAIHQLDENFGFPSKKLDIVVVCGTSGKSSTMHYTSKLLQEENLQIGSFYTPHMHVYNERFVINNEQISNNTFTEIANKVINIVEDKKIAASTKDILTMMAFIFFTEHNVNLALFEYSQTYTLDPVLYCNAKIVAVTRIVSNTPSDDTPAAFTNIMSLLNPQTYFVSADQNKQNLQIMKQFVESKGSNWCMPTRKLAPLAYPFEQLHGRCGALAEKIAHIYNDTFLHKNSTNIVNASLLTRPKGLRGRPTLEAKKSSETYPKKSLEKFWNQTISNLSNRFEFISTSKPMILLDTADNIDALTNAFLGFRLLAYKQQFKNVALIIGCHQDQFVDDDFLKELRFFAKKTSGMIAFCPIENIVGEKSKPSWDLQKIAHLAKMAKIKCKVFKNFAEAFSTAKATYDDSNSIIFITGSQSIVAQYHAYKTEATQI